MRLIVFIFIFSQSAFAFGSGGLDSRDLQTFKNQTEPLFSSPKAKIAEGFWSDGAYEDCARAFSQLADKSTKSDLKVAARFRAARCFERARSFKDAKRVYQGLTSHKVMGPLAMLRLAVVLHELGEAKAATDLLTHSDLQKDPALSKRAHTFHARVLEAAKKNKELVDVFKASTSSEIQMKVAMARLELGDTYGAKQSLRKIFVENTRKKLGRKARAELAKLAPKCFSEAIESPPCLEAHEMLSMAGAHFRAHASKVLVAFLGPLLKTKAFSDKLVRCEGLWLLARSYDKLRTRKPAQPVYDEAIVLCAGHKREVDLLYFGGVSAYREDRDSVALKHFKALHKRFPKHSYNDDAVLYEAQIHQEAGKTRKAERTLKKGISRYPDGDMNVELRWRYVWYALSKGKTWVALKRIESMKKGAPPTKNSLKRGRLEYWEARILERRGKKKKARLLFRRLMRKSPMTYHALLAYTRLQKLSGKRRAKRYLDRAMAPSKKKRKRASSKIILPAVLERVGLLIRMGMLDEAQKQLARVQSKVDSKDLVLLADLADRSGQNLIAVRIMKRVLSDHPELKLNQETRPIWQLAYPRAFRKIVEGNTSAAGVDPYLAWSIMRTESGFNARIESWANAIGLMQLIMPTAKRMAEIGQKVRVSAETLRQPETNVRLGVRYLKYLQDRYPHLVTIAAGYNAGGGRAKQWLKKRKRMNVDLFVAHIPFRQTRHYAMRVLESWFRYNLAYEESLPSLPFRMPRIRRP